MVSKIESYQPQESYGDEYFALQVAAKKISSAKEAIGFAMTLEIDSILYFFKNTS